VLLVLFLDRYHHLFYSLIPISYCDVESVTQIREIDATKEVDVDIDKVSWKTTFVILALTSLTLGVALFIGYNLSWGGSGSGGANDFSSHGYAGISGLSGSSGSSGASVVRHTIDYSTYDKF
jgi:hypothetical protein